MWADELFIWDFVVDTVFEDIIEWFYGQLIGFLSSFFGMMGNMGAEIFDLVWVQGIVHFFVYLAWALYVTGLDPGDCPVLFAACLGALCGGTCGGGI